jgi:hypothetical protein
LGTGTVTPGRGTGGGAPNPGAQAVQQAAFLAAAVGQGLITQDESDVFAEAHDTVDARMAELRGATNGSPVNELLPDVLAELVASGDLTQDQADTFLSVRRMRRLRCGGHWRGRRRGCWATTTCGLLEPHAHPAAGE